MSFSNMPCAASLRTRCRTLGVNSIFGGLPSGFAIARNLDFKFAFPSSVTVDAENAIGCRCEINRASSQEGNTDDCIMAHAKDMPLLNFNTTTPALLLLLCSKSNAFKRALPLALNAGRLH